MHADPASLNHRTQRPHATGVPTRCLVPLVAFAVALAPLTASVATPRYRLTVLTGLSSASGLADTDAVVGEFDDAGVPRAALFVPGLTPPVAVLAESLPATGQGISASGMFASGTNFINPTPTAFRVFNNQVTDLDPEQVGSSALAVNSLGWVAGRFGDDAVVWSPTGVRTTLRVTGNQGGLDAQASAVSDAGFVAGTVMVNGFARAFRWTEAGGLMLLPGLGGAESRAWGVNNLGEVVGRAGTTSGDTVPFIFRNGSMTSLGLLPGTGDGVALAINDQGEVVGQDGGFIGFTSAWHWQNGVKTPLAELLLPGELPEGWVLTQAVDINQQSSVLARAVDPALFEFHWVLLRLDSTTPLPCSLADITGIGGPPSFPDGLLTGDDFNAFIAAFAAEDALADITGIGGPPEAPDGLITGDDFNAFISTFAAGCP